MNSTLSDLAIAAGLFSALAIALEVGFRFGRRTRLDSDSTAGGQVGAVQGALLGLLGLLLAFSFSAAGSRFLERQDLIVTEANAIGTAYLRADLLDEPQRSALRDSLQRYTEHRIAVSARLREGYTPADAAEVDRLQSQIWSAASVGVRARPEAIVAVLPPVNDVIDLHATRIAAGRKRLPPLVMGLLIACSLLSVSVLGYGCGFGGRRRAPLTLPLALLIGTALWITIDLDNPRAGLMRLSDAPLKEIKFGHPAP